MDVRITIPIASLAFMLQAHAQGQAGDPLRSGECQRALDVLAAQERVMEAQAPLAGRPAWRAAQRQAAIACLGRADVPAPQHLAQPPVRVAPVVVPRPPAPRVDTPTPALPAKAVEPTTLTSCDPVGCWASDGTRLQRNGPDLVGPRGLCSVVGGVLRCP